ncbi:MAG: MMPL family transporter [Solirubrobacterales bacterium]
MFTALGNVTTRHPWRVLALLGLITVAAVLASSGLADRLASQGFTDPGAESSAALDRIASAAGVDLDTEVVALVATPAGIESSAARAKIADVAKKLNNEPDMAVVRTPFDGNKLNSALVARDGKSAIVTGFLKPGKLEGDGSERLSEAFHGERGVTLGGGLIAQDQVSSSVEEDLQKAEMIAFPVLFILAFFVFRGLIAAALPLMIGAITIPVSMAMISFYDGITDLSVFALNLTTGLGLGLAIDYSLLIVSRFREEVAAGAETGPAVRRTVATAGKTVLFSSLTVAGSAAALTIFPLKFLYSMGLGGATVALASAAVALTVLPAVLMLLGPRIDKFSFARGPVDHANSRWHRMAVWVMNRPAAVALGTTLVIVLLTIPAFGMKFTSVDTTVLPTTSPPRIVAETVEREYPPSNSNASLFVVVDAPRDDAKTPRALAASVEKLPTIESVAAPVFVAKDTWRFDVYPDGTRFSAPAQDAVSAIRDLPATTDRWVGGQSASFVDQRASILDRVPLALLLIGSVTFIVLFLMTGSVVLPIKTFIMNIATLAATFGILTLIFQDGRLEGVLDYTSQGALEMTQPVLLFAIAFGLATDYGVFLLGRIKELHDSGQSNEEAVANGVARTGRVITSAALLFCVAIGAFAISEIVFIKELGVGTALAVAIDATLIRAFLVPALMVLLGDYNWWAPRPLRKLHAKIGINEGPSAPVAASDPAMN